MRAEIFYYTKEQMDIALKLKELLRTHIHPTVSLTLSDVLTQGDVTALGWRYMKLLQASIPPEKGIKLSISEIGLAGYSFYIKVYYPFVFATRSFQAESTRRFFPALAIHDRMVLIPRGLTKLLEHEDGLVTPFNPLKMGGVEEVDFTNADELCAALDRVAEVLRAEIYSGLRAYASYHVLRDLDIASLAEAFGVEANYLLHVWQTMSKTHSLHADLTCDLDKHEIARDRWSKLTLRIRNNSGLLLSNVEVKVSGPARILPFPIRANIPPGLPHEISIAVMPEAAGDFPLEVSFVLPEDMPFSSFLPAHYLWLHCA